jgi:hypothetical protein
VLALILVDLGLLGANVLGYPPFWQQPNSALYVLAPLTLLLVYAGAVLALTWRPAADRRQVLRTGTRLGLLAGLLWSSSLTIEIFAHLASPANLCSTAPFLLGGFGLWGVASFRSARQGHSLPASIVAAIWAGMITALVTIAWGFLIGLVALPRLAEQIAGSPEQLSSGWQDLPAFAIANQFDAGFSHLLAAPIIGSLLGTLGAIMGSSGSRAGTR